VDNHAYQEQASQDPGYCSESERARLADANDIITYLQTINKLRDIYIDSSVFKNPVWDAFLTLYARLLADEPVTLASLCTGTRVAPDDCAAAVECLRDAGLVEPAADGEEPQPLALTAQGKQRMGAFLRSASRGR
jgi:hypothetical protein